MQLRAQVLERPRMPRTMRTAVSRAVRLGIDGLRSVPPMRLADWAAENFVLAGESSHQRGGWEAWPFQIGPLDWMGDDDIYEFDMLKSKRVGYTKMLTASICFDAAHRRRNQAVWQPTDDDRDSFVKSEIEPVIEGVPAVARAKRMTKGAEDTIKLKQFRGCVAHFLGGKAARAYRRITVAAGKLDELSGFDQQIEKSADPFTLAEGRLEGAPFPKMICGSTPRLKGLDHTEHRASLAEVFMRYHIECPRCGVEHPLEFGSKRQAWGFKWDKGRPETVRHVCPHCQKSISQADYLANWKGTWVCRKTGARYGADRTWRDAAGQPMRTPRHVAAHIWTAYSPQREWSDIVKQWLAAVAKHEAGDDGPLQGFVNEVLGETFEEEFEKTEADHLRKRAEAEGLRMGIVPRGGVFVTAFIDVQGDRWEYGAWAAGRGGEKWAVDYRVIYGNTGSQEEWEAKIEPLTRVTYPHASGAVVRVSHLSIDSGFQTHVVYAFCRKYAARNVHATKGDGEPGKPIKYRRVLLDVKEKGRKIRRGVAVWHVGIDTAKDLLHGQLQIDKPGPGYVHFAADLPASFYSGLTAEKRVPVRTRRGIEHRWDCPPGVRNEPLDICVGSMFGFELLDLHRYSEADWARAERDLEPDLFGAPAPAAVPPDQASDVHAHAQPPTPVDREPPRRKTYPKPAPVAEAIASDEWMSRL